MFFIGIERALHGEQNYISGIALGCFVHLLMARIQTAVFWTIFADFLPQPLVASADLAPPVFRGWTRIATHSIAHGERYNSIYVSAL